MPHGVNVRGASRKFIGWIARSRPGRGRG